MTHLPIATVLLAAFAGFLLTLGASLGLAWQRRLSLAFMALELVAAIASLRATLSGTPLVYALGDWPAPFGIVLVLDRLSGLMVLLTALVAGCTLLAAVRGWDGRGRLFHALFHFQLMGLFGAFLTGDLFNLFVFFEILLIASYGLLLHGGGAERSRAGIKYVVVNLTGSALFLVAVGTLYGITGTLNMADIAVKAPNIAAADLPWLRASAFLFLVVFGIKAALLPLSFWLPDAYSKASPPVAALFAIMTKVGVYCIVRVHTLAFGGAEGLFGNGLSDWLLAAALLTLLIGMAGALQSRSLSRLVAYLGIASVGTILSAVATLSSDALAGGLFYLVHSTLTLALLFLLAGQVSRSRGAISGDTLYAGQRPEAPATLAVAFLFAAMSMAGIPPFTGFLGKVLILDGVAGQPGDWLIWVFVLGTGLMSVVTLSRAGSTLFWKSQTTGSVDSNQARTGGIATACLLLLIAATAVLAGPLHRFTSATADDLLAPSGYVNAVLSNRNVITREG